MFFSGQVKSPPTPNYYSLTCSIGSLLKEKASWSNQVINHDTESNLYWKLIVSEINQIKLKKKQKKTKLYWSLLIEPEIKKKKRHWKHRMNPDKSSLESFICQGQVADSQNSYSSQLESQWIPRAWDFAQHHTVSAQFNRATTVTS